MEDTVMEDTGMSPKTSCARAMISNKVLECPPQEARKQFGQFSAFWIHGSNLRGITAELTGAERKINHSKGRFRGLLAHRYVLS